MTYSDTLIHHFTHFQWRVLQDALQEGTADYWLKRAAELEAARPQPDDYPGHITTLEQANQDHRLAMAAQACRHQARFVRAYGIDDASRDAIARIAGIPDEQAS